MEYGIEKFTEDELFFKTPVELVGDFTNAYMHVDNEPLIEGIRKCMGNTVAEMLAPCLKEFARNNAESTV